MAAMNLWLRWGRARICQEVLYAKKERALGIQRTSTNPVVGTLVVRPDRSGPLT